MSRYSNQTKSDCRRYGVTIYESILEKCFIEMGLFVERHRVYCFRCHNKFAHEGTQYPSKCQLCGVPYTEPGMYAMPDLVIEDSETGGRGIIYVNGAAHDNKEKQKKKDKYQISIFRGDGFKVFTINNEELDLLRHANRCFLVYGIYTAIKSPEVYEKAFMNEKELLH